MRHYRYDARDLLQGFLLAFDIRRVLFGTLAATWTGAVVLLFYAIFAWRAQTLPGDSSQIAWRALTDYRPSPERVVLWLGALGIWWLGFSRLAAPILRSQALEVARDQRLKLSEISVSARRLGGMVTWSPLAAAFVPVLMFALVLLWALLAKIPGTAGEIFTLVLLPFALLFGFVGALGTVTVALAAPLMGPAAVVEGHDALEAVSRAISYLFQRPFRFLGYLALKLLVKVAALAAAALALGLTWGFLLAGLHVVGEGALASQTLQLALTPGEVPSEATLPLARLLSGISWSTAVIAFGWWLVVVLGVDVMRYMLLRYQVDGVTYDEVMIPKEYLDVHRHLNAIETAEQAAKAREESPEPAPEPAKPVA